MSLLFSFVGFAAELVVIISVVGIVVSCIFLPQSNVAVDIRDDYSNAELAVIADDVLQFMVTTLTDESDATLSCASSYCAKSMTSPAYTTTIDELVVSPPDYSTMTIRELKALCKDRRIKGYSSLRKHELIALLSAL